jgi:hypothetical protein
VPLVAQAPLQEQVLLEALVLLPLDCVVHLRHLEVLVDPYQEPTQLLEVEVLDPLMELVEPVVVVEVKTIVPLAAVVVMALAVL